jgi:hypothetical protein
MRTRLSLILLPLMFVAGTSGSLREPKETKDGNCNDDHGNLTWESSADPSTKNDDWKYARSVTNQSKKLRCHVAWENRSSGFKWKSTLETEEKQNPGTFSTDLPPEDADGKITYDGGKQAGDASTSAPAWVPKTKQAASSSHFSAEADVAFELHGGIVKIHINGSSDVKKDAALIHYLIDLGPVTGEKVIGTSDIRFRWTTAGKMFKPPLTELGDEIGNEEIVSFKENKSGMSFSFSATAKVPDQKSPSLLVGSLQVLDRKGTVIGEAPLPALGTGK